MELDGSDNILDKYIRGINLIKNNTSYFLYNAHGDVVHLTDSAGAVTKRYHYDAFGNEVSPSAGDGNPWRYCGEYFDGETGTVYLRARYYDPGIGRFLTEDSVRVINRVMPNKQELPDPLSLNLYTYCANNPILYRDDSGHFFVLAALIVGVVTGAVAGAIYSQVNYGEVRWQNVAAGVAIGGLAGLTVGVGGALIFGGGIGASSAQVGAGLAAMFASQAPMVIDGVKSIWEKGATLRGQLIEKALGGMNNNFPVIDKFVKGARGFADSMTSIKSMDIFAKSYEKAGAIYKQIMNYGNALYNFQGKNWGGYSVWADEATMKFLELAIPRGATPEQLMQIQRATVDLAQKGIQVIVHVFK